MLFAFRLCQELGYAHPDYLLPELTSRQLSEWMAYFDWVNSDERPQQTSEEMRDVLDSVLEGVLSGNRQIN